MDITSLIGPIVGWGLVVLGMTLEGGHFLPILLGYPAWMIVLGGTTGAMLLACPMTDITKAFSDLKLVMSNAEIPNPILIKDDIIMMANTARKDSILALEKMRSNLTNEFLSKAVRMAVDGMDPTVIKDSLETESSIMEEHLEISAKFWEDMGGICPTIGILGAVLGLMHVMENLSNPDMIGPGIATAFIATVAGVGMSNIIFMPLAKKIKRKAKLQADSREMTIIGILGILEGLNPRVIEEKLQIFTGEHSEET